MFIDILNWSIAYEKSKTPEPWLISNIPISELIPFASMATQLFVMPNTQTLTSFFSRSLFNHRPLFHSYFLIALNTKPFFNAKKPLTVRHPPSTAPSYLVVLPAINSKVTLSQPLHLCNIHRKYPLQYPWKVSLTIQLPLVSTNSKHCWTCSKNLFPTSNGTRLLPRISKHSPSSKMLFPPGNIRLLQQATGLVFFFIANLTKG